MKQKKWNDGVEEEKKMKINDNRWKKCNEMPQHKTFLNVTQNIRNKEMQFKKDNSTNGTSKMERTLKAAETSKIYEKQ